MAQTNIPVTLDYFKKYTYYEECVDYMLKLKANGNQQTYNALIKSKEARESALKSYHAAFYLRPAIRKAFHIRLKAAPKKIKDKLLLIPVQGAGGSNQSLTRVQKIDTKESQMQDIAKDFHNDSSKSAVKGIKSYPKKEEHKRRILLAAKDESEEVYVVDDDEPLSSQDITSTIPENNNEKSLPSDTQKDNKEDTNHEEIACKSAGEKDVDMKNTQINLEVQQNSENKANASPPSSTSNKPNFNYKDLVPYVHCCPLTFKEFRKYSNINALVREFCENRQINTSEQQRMVLHRSYLLFYLAPEHRKIKPINKIRLLDACPSHIKEKFFSIPTNLFLKDENNPNKSQNVVAATEINANKNSNNAKQEIVVAAATSTISEPHATKPVLANQNVAMITAVVTKSSEMDTANVQKNISTDGTVDTVSLNTSCGKNNEAQNTHDTTQMVSVPNNCQISNSVIDHKLLQAATTSANDSLISLPVSLDVFKTYTYYEEIVEKLFKIKAQHNKDLYVKYICSQEAFDKTLENYYRAFYTLPAIREVCPIRLKPMSDFIKSDLLCVPDGVKVTDLSKFKLEQLVKPVFTITPLNDEQSSNAQASPVLRSVENKSMEIPEIPALIKPNSSSTTSSPNSNVTTFKIENTESTYSERKSHSASAGNKRISNELMESSAAKRNKVDQHQEISNKTKKGYKDLLPYAHCCPTSFSEFNKYTNIAELLSAYCQKQYKSNKKLPFMTQRAYILFYLAPENRKLKPFNKLKIKDECPPNLRDKIFQIPTDIYLKGKKNDNLLSIKKEKIGIQTPIKIEEPTTHETASTNDNQISQRTATHPKEPIQILENRLLPSITPPFPGQPIEQSNKCSNTTCVFHHISAFDFMKLTNVLSILPEPQEMTVVQNLFKKFIYKIVKEQRCDNNVYVINCDLLCKLLKYNNMCEKCENDVKPTVMANLDMTAASSMSENERVSNVSNEQTVIERCVVVNNKSSISNQSISQTQPIAKEQQRQQQQQQHDIWKFLRRDKIFENFCQKLLAKLNQSFDATVDFSSESYTIFLQCNEIPLKQILNDFCENNEDVVERILNHLELNETLQRYYYFKYLTNENFALKYPAKVKQTDLIANCNIPQESSIEKFNEKGEKVNEATNTLGREEINKNREETADNSITSSHNKSMTSNNGLEKAKRIFFRSTDKTHTLAYVLRTSFDLKQFILKTILSLTFKEFLEFTNIYEGKELYEDEHIAKCMYRYVFRTPLVWPTNLYMTLHNLCKFLHKRNIHFDDYSTMLTHISPKLMHWSDLLSCTNILDCIKIDFEKRTGKLLDTYDIKTLKRECIDYYNRCWKHEKWLGEIPVVYEEFYNGLLDDAMEAGIEMTIEQMDTSINTESVAKESNCAAFSNTQQHSLGALNVEKSVSHNPIDNNNQLNLNISSSTCESYDVISVGELIPQIKTEPADCKLLSNLLFYEDENSNIQCLTREEEIVDLDNTMQVQGVEENLPPSQIDLEETTLNHIPNYILVNSSDSSSLINLAQQIPSSNESGSLCTQHFMQPQDTAKYISSTQLIQLPDVTLTSSGENDICENVPDLNKVAEAGPEDDICTEILNDKQVAELATSSSTNAQTYQEETLQEEHLIGQRISEEIVNNVLAAIDEQQQQLQQQEHPIDHQTDASIATWKSTHHQSNTLKASVLPIRRPITKTYTATKITKNIATIKPLKNSGLVPQIQHNTRPLQTVPVHPAVSSNNNQVLQPPVSEILPPASVTLSLTPTNGGSDATSHHECTQNSSFQLQLSNLATHIYISQEFNKNCSVFDNTSLLRVADHNYHKSTKNMLSSSEMSQIEIEERSKNSGTLGEQQQQQQQQQQLVAISNANQKADNSMCLNENILATNDQSQSNNEPSVRRAICENSSCPEGSMQQTTATSDNQQQTCPTIVTRSNNNLLNTNDEVNNIQLTTHTSNVVVASIRLTIHRPPLPHFPNMTQKLYLHRTLLKFHYFKKLTSQHISKYLLPSLEIGKSYSEALVACDSFKTRISNRSISALFPFWSKNLQRDFLLVLNDLNEFHYVVYDHALMQNHKDLRVRILYGLLYTAPAFSLCQFTFDANNSEFSYCESVKNAHNPTYKRKPFKCITNALKPNILKKLREMKNDLNRN